MVTKFMLDPNYTLSTIAEVLFVVHILMDGSSQAVLRNHVYFIRDFVVKYMLLEEGICIVSGIYFLETIGKSKLAAMGNDRLQAPFDCCYLIRK